MSLKSQILENQAAKDAQRAKDCRLDEFTTKLRNVCEEAFPGCTIHFLQLEKDIWYRFTVIFSPANEDTYYCYYANTRAEVIESVTAEDFKGYVVEKAKPLTTAQALAFNFNKLVPAAYTFPAGWAICILGMVTASGVFVSAGIITAALALLTRNLVDNIHFTLSYKK